MFIYSKFNNLLKTPNYCEILRILKIFRRTYCEQILLSQNFHAYLCSTHIHSTVVPTSLQDTFLFFAKSPTLKIPTI